jgi:hypothetical protein
MAANIKTTGPYCLSRSLHQSNGRVRSIVTAAGKGLFVFLLATSLGDLNNAVADGAVELVNANSQFPANHAIAIISSIKPKSVMVHRLKRADFEQVDASKDVRYVANWVIDSNDSRDMPFLIVDKMNAKVFVFYADGRLRGVAPALLGLARGDDAVPGIGDRKLSSIHPDERTTPAGRFVSSLDLNIKGKEILWVDYDAAISLHPVITTNFKEHRAQRLETPTSLDNRISYGCINVPAKFFTDVVSPAFTGTNGIVYVLPETRPLHKTFNSYDVDERK